MGWTQRRSNRESRRERWTQGMSGAGRLREILRDFLERFGRVGSNFRPTNLFGFMIGLRDRFRPAQVVCLGGWRSMNWRRLFVSVGYMAVGRGFFHFVDKSVLRPARSRQALAELKRDVVVERAGVSLLVRDTQLRQEIDNNARFDLELAGQLIDANFTHTVAPWRLITRRRGFK